MENSNCCVCQKPKANLECGVCHEHVCKKCAQFVEDGSFSFYKTVPKILQSTVFCGPCYDREISPAIAEYEQIMKKAKGISIFMKEDSKITQRFSRKENPIEIKECEDKDELVMRMAFLAVTGGFNALVDVEIKHEKVKPGGKYQYTNWSGKGIPTLVTSSRHL
ncbi:hypothetical protein B9G69_016095 [Bdellovibrio sp. SKB1291214]|uniref:hypothetical protein n=1 Tax=Bdellovibrio sp. SKB1291214 TaxID=1732569 RepID=UPI000B51B877|nr:hypothetical protein [Bdellovibrio sp. SKB1291214]UYL08566.1 hypothetical protein B9G69_016095 [Bdellovibrio sp. SKB1291214]